jgi:hypothetical protein
MGRRDFTRYTLKANAIERMKKSIVRNASLVRGGLFAAPAHAESRNGGPCVLG